DFFIDVNGKPDVNGMHILYLDLMGKQTQMGQTEYQEELSRQRWTMYRTFYMEAKRKIKLEIEQFQDCPALSDELRATDQMTEINSDQEMEEWARENFALGYDSISDA